MCVLPWLIFQCSPHWHTSYIFVGTSWQSARQKVFITILLPVHRLQFRCYLKCYSMSVRRVRPPDLTKMYRFTCANKKLCAISGHTDHCTYYLLLPGAKFVARIVVNQLSTGRVTNKNTTLLSSTLPLSTDFWLPRALYGQFKHNYQQVVSASVSVIH